MDLITTDQTKEITEETIADQTITDLDQITMGQDLIVDQTTDQDLTTTDLDLTMDQDPIGQITGLGQLPMLQKHLINRF